MKTRVGSRWYNSGLFLFRYANLIPTLFGVAVEISLFVLLRVPRRCRAKEVHGVRTVLILRYNVTHASYRLRWYNHCETQVLQDMQSTLVQTQHYLLTERCSRCQGRDHGRRSLSAMFLVRWRDGVVGSEAGNRDEHSSPISYSEDKRGLILHFLCKIEHLN